MNYPLVREKIAQKTGIGVAYGYALPGELEEAGADFVVQDVAELQKLLLGKE